MLKCIIDNETKLMLRIDEYGYAVRVIKSIIETRTGINVNDRLCVHNGKIIGDPYRIKIKPGTLHTMFFMTSEQYKATTSDERELRIQDNRELVRVSKRMYPEFNVRQHEIPSTITIEPVPLDYGSRLPYYKKEKQIMKTPLPKLWY